MTDLVPGEIFSAANGINPAGEVVGSIVSDRTTLPVPPCEPGDSEASPRGARVARAGQAAETHLTAAGGLLVGVNVRNHLNASAQVVERHVAAGAGLEPATPAL